MIPATVRINPSAPSFREARAAVRARLSGFRSTLRRKAGPLAAMSIGSLGMTVAAQAQSDPFTTTTSTVETMLTGTFAKLFVVIVMVLAGVPIAMGSAGDHKGKLVGTVVGCVIILAAQSVVTWLIPS